MGDGVVEEVGDACRRPALVNESLLVEDKDWEGKEEDTGGEGRR